MFLFGIFMNQKTDPAPAAYHVLSKFPGRLFGRDLQRLLPYRVPLVSFSRQVQFPRAVSGSSNHPRQGAVLLGLGQNSGHNSFPVHGEASTDKRTSIEIVQQTS
jgi:hypothetical protein